MPALLPDDWKGGFVLLVVIAHRAELARRGADRRHDRAARLPRKRSHRLSCSNRRRSQCRRLRQRGWRYHDDHMWIAGVSPLSVVEAFVAAAVAIVIFGIPAALQQHRFSPIKKDPSRGLQIEWMRALIVAAILITAILSNVIANLKFPALLDRVPVIGIAVWAMLLLLRHCVGPTGRSCPRRSWARSFAVARNLRLDDAGRGASVRLLADCARSRLPSAVFDNIPLTALALKQGGYDWGYLAYTVGFGGSMIWFGLGRRGALQHVSGSEVRRFMAGPRLACCHRLRDRLLRHARRSGVAP